MFAIPVEWTEAQERQYRPIVEGKRGSGESQKRAQEIAARTIAKERAQRGRLQGAVDARRFPRPHRSPAASAAAEPGTAPAAGTT